MMNPAKDSVYSGVVGLRSLCIISFLAELNGLELMAADVGNAYLEARTKEKVCFIAGPEFGALANHLTHQEYHWVPETIPTCLYPIPHWYPQPRGHVWGDARHL